MKKAVRMIVLVLAVVLASAVIVFASGENTVISLSYLNGTYMSQLSTGLKQAADELQTVYASALERLMEKTGQAQLDPSWSATSTFQTIYPRSGETVTLSAGSGVIWYSGTGAASAVLVDVTSGTELASGSALTAGHRYLAEQETVITAVSASSCGAEGVWKTTATGSAPVQSPFKDVAQGDWYFDAVMYVVERGLFNGTSTTTFEPNTVMNRAMLVTVLHRIAGEPAVSGSNPFNDVVYNEWYMPGVLWASQAGIVNGTSATTFEPYSRVTREQIAVLLYRYSAYCGYDVSARASIAGFNDHGKVSDYAQEAMSWVVATGLMVGSDGKLNPGNGATRAEVATLLQRYEAWVSHP